MSNEYYNKLKEDRKAVANFSGFSSTSGGTGKCRVCQQRGDIITQDGKKVLRCRKGCKDTPIEEPQQQEGKFLSKYGNKAGTVTQLHIVTKEEEKTSWNTRRRRTTTTRSLRASCSVWRFRW